jgi:hypothetical protein
LIQEEHDCFSTTGCKQPYGRQAMPPVVFLKSIACTFPPLATRRCKLASVLDLEQYHLLR